MSAEKPGILITTLEAAATAVILRGVGLSHSWLDWLLPWRAYRWQKRATEIMVRQITRELAGGDR